MLIVLLIVFSCKNNKKNAHVEHIDYSKEDLNVTTSVYPENISKVFEAHGGLDTWHAMQSLEFTMHKPKGDEVTLTDLKNRKSLIHMPNHTIGYNGKDVWLYNKSDKNYKKDPRFYYNLMFYFYAMPFVVADDGIIYKDVEPLVFEGKSYPGILISYDDGVGESPEDEYIIYYDEATYKMEWLAYTVTYFTKEKSKEFHFRRFNNWQEVEGLLLPKTMVKYKYKNNKPTTANGETTFIDIKLSKEKPKPELFEVPKGAKIIE